MWWKVLISVVAVLVILLVIAEFGVRAYAKNTVVDEIRSSLEEGGTELSEDPSVSFGASPLLLGLVQGKIPSMSATMPSTVEVSYEDGDQSRPVITGQPAVEMDAKNISVSGESMLIDDLTLDTTMPPEMLLAELQKSEAAGGAEDGEDGEQAQNSEDDNPFSGALDNLISITDVAMNTGENTLDFEISGGLATLSMVPEVTEGTLSMSLSDVKIFGMSLPQSVAESLSDQLESTVNEASEELTVKSAEVTEDGLKIRLHGTQINMDEIDTSGAFGTESGSGADSGANSEDQAA
ncbi:MAG TPA: DUF2993 domain-containing protein [Candidatus Corynebacterium faecigallinarum]|uniref:DUF2993 domain-containing protein n=1 Tax=Candidatus Corynebacterium faecigallinarum TaxID=2838528 RepID=A0A9D2QBH4_9CORY|nr:DUF2993 domain-containing protein [Candidatus Corynebacterium faecigallinarum]